MIDPRTPCPFPLGSEEKLCWLEARAAEWMPLFDAADLQGLRWLNPVEPRKPSKGDVHDLLMRMHREAMARLASV